MDFQHVSVDVDGKLELRRSFAGPFALGGQAVERPPPDSFVACNTAPATQLQTNPTSSVAVLLTRMRPGAHSG